jgi:hypothetical protein
MKVQKRFAFLLAGLLLTAVTAWAGIQMTEYNPDSTWHLAD